MRNDPLYSPGFELVAFELTMQNRRQTDLYICRYDGKMNLDPVHVSRQKAYTMNEHRVDLSWDAKHHCGHAILLDSNLSIQIFEIGANGWATLLIHTESMEALDTMVCINSEHRVAHCIDKAYVPSNTNFYTPGVRIVKWMIELRF
jgi:hypothetical protein